MNKTALLNSIRASDWTCERASIASPSPGWGVTPVLAPDWGTPSLPPGKRTWDQRLGYPFGKGLGPETGDWTWDQRLGYPSGKGLGPETGDGTWDLGPETGGTPLERAWDQKLEMGSGTWDQRLGYTSPPWTERKTDALWKHYLPVIRGR